MSFVHAILLFVGGPAVVIALCYLLAYVTSRDTASAGTFKMGDHWREPLWFVGHPREVAAAHRPALEAGSEHVPSATMVGGASGTW